MNLAGKKRLDGATPLVDPKALGRGVESDAVEMREQRVDRGRPLTRAPTDSVPDPHAVAEIPSEQGDLVHGVSFGR
jgi:hypothetical protein